MGGCGGEGGELERVFGHLVFLKYLCIFNFRIKINKIICCDVTLGVNYSCRAYGSGQGERKVEREREREREERKVEGGGWSRYFLGVSLLRVHSD